MSGRETRHEISHAEVKATSPNYWNQDTDLSGHDDCGEKLDGDRVGGDLQRRRLEFQPGGDQWVVLADPEGHLFCLAARD